MCNIFLIWDEFIQNYKIYIAKYSLEILGFNKTTPVFMIIAIIANVMSTTCCGKTFVHSVRPSIQNYLSQVSYSQFTSSFIILTFWKGTQP